MVGPESVGAHPGPVAYQKGGQLAITDANLVLGRILPEFFPHVSVDSSLEHLPQSLVQRRSRDMLRGMCCELPCFGGLLLECLRGQRTDQEREGSAVTGSEEHVEM